MRKNLSEYKKDDKVLDFFMVKSCELRTSNKGGEYMDMVISDNSGEMVAKVWDMNRDDTAAVKDIQGRDIVKIQGVVTEWNGAKQLKILKIRKAAESDEVNVSELVKSAPYSGERLYDMVCEKGENIKDKELRLVTMTLIEDNAKKLIYYPAASKNHHAIKGGLLYHMYRMLLHAEMLCDIYPMLSKDLLVCGVIVHDIAKVEEIDADEFGIADSYTFEGQMLGHIIQGIKMLETVCERFKISEEKKIMVQHMILSHHYEPEFGSPKKPMFPEAEMLHYLDIIDARIYDMESGLEGVEPGEFSEKIWSMDNRKMYKPSFGE
ncbi:MAG: HD domain-containing protein [Clostridiales bacterium]|nr:HD domain-containing protein [Clostridiales bacterium]